LLRVMQAARETHAGTVFDPVAVKSRLNQAAAAGQAHCVLPAPFDLRKTDAAQTIITWCQQEGLRTEWSLRPAPEAHGEAAYDLVISWRPEAANP
ncbi:hypothetical protein, partial [Methylorubrum sp. SB2]|uniref:hypothetical protein n=1 Tax=Methylorubrum subtropicum TaxID=3138812 RepID=UPI00313DB1E2